MSPEIRQTKLAEIDAESDRKRSEAEYIIEVVESNEAALRTVFVTDDKKMDDNQTDLFLYSEVQSILNSLIRGQVRTVGISLYYRSKDDENDPKMQLKLPPEVKLGWAYFGPAMQGFSDHPSDVPFPHTLRPTTLGLQLINGLRAAQGLASVEQQFKLNREAALD
jgi:hypothetical protein